MYSERKLRYDRSIIYKFYLCVLLVVSALLFSDKVMAETLAEHATNEVQKNVFKELPVWRKYNGRTLCAKLYWKYQCIFFAVIRKR